MVGTDPGTSSLDLLLLEDGLVADQARLTPQALAAQPEALVWLLDSWKPLDLIAGPSGYGLPLVRGEDLTEEQFDLMSLVRPDERGRSTGIVGFRGWLRSLLAAELPVIFLPGGIHLPTIPRHRKRNAIDMGTADKVAVAALALHQELRLGDADREGSSFAVVELGSAFTAVMVLQEGRIVDAAAGTRGPLGLRSGGAWDGEAAYWRGYLSKEDLFRGGLADLGEDGLPALVESLLKCVAGLRAVTPFDRVLLSGLGLEREEVRGPVLAALGTVAAVAPIRPLDGAWVKQAAQGSALLADGLAGGSSSCLVEALRLREASGTALDHLMGPWTGAI